MLREMLDETMAGWAQERPDLDLAPMATFLRLAQLSTVALRAIDAAFAPHGINVGEFDVLAALRRGGTGTVLTPTALAHAAMVSRAGMTNRLDRLAAAGLVDRRPDPNDRRGSLVGLTARGRAVVDAAVTDHVAVEAALLAGLSAADQARLDRLLDRLLAHLDRAAGADPPGA
jgi:DNA-binding MarR family transcriptional regulator